MTKRIDAGTFRAIFCLSYAWLGVLDPDVLLVPSAGPLWRQPQIAQWLGARQRFVAPSWLAAVRAVPAYVAPGCKDKKRLSDSPAPPPTPRHGHRAASLQ